MNIARLAITSLFAAGTLLAGGAAAQHYAVTATSHQLIVAANPQGIADCCE
ncbi:MAG TPA: hypothetical protein VMA32_15100 [Streptosporangiaceae bacterium]|nr:hypothetical protein [Streptosporangiaceae bacterium]